MKTEVYTWAPKSYDPEGLLSKPVKALIEVGKPFFLKNCGVVKLGIFKSSRNKWHVTAIYYGMILGSGSTAGIAKKRAGKVLGQMMDTQHLFTVLDIYAKDRDQAESIPAYKILNWMSK